MSSAHDGTPADQIRACFEEAIEAGLKRESVSGSSDDEIDAMADEQGVSHVPSAIREVLRIVGKRPGMWLAGSTFGTSLVRSKENENAKLTLNGFDQEIQDSANILVIASHGAYEYIFIDGADTERDNPPVWRVTEGTNATRAWPTVTDWFRDITPDVDEYKERLEIMLEMRKRRLPPWAEDFRLDEMM
jgi:hypothetical protein